MKKIVFILGCFIFVHLGFAVEVHAEETVPSTETSTVIYSVEQGGLQEFEIEDDLGENYIIIVEEEPQFFIMASSVKNGTYKITKEKALQWKASYKIDVNNHKITRAHSAIATAFTGSFKSLSLKVDNSKQATYYLKRAFLIGEASINLRAKLSGNNILITY